MATRNPAPDGETNGRGKGKGEKKNIQKEVEPEPKEEEEEEENGEENGEKDGDGGDESENVAAMTKEARFFSVFLFFLANKKDAPASRRH